MFQYSATLFVSWLYSSLAPILFGPLVLRSSTEVLDQPLVVDLLSISVQVTLDQFLIS